MSLLNIVLVHLGDGSLPNHIRETFCALGHLRTSSRIFFIANEHNREPFKSIQAQQVSKFDGGIQFISAESIPASADTKAFRQGSKLNKKYRKGFWFHASHRFYVLADYMAASHLENCLHLETDVVLYFDPAKKLSQFQAFAQFAVPLDRTRAIPGVVWIQNAMVARLLVEHMVQQKHKDDMATLGEFCLSNPALAKPLPTIPPSYASDSHLDQDRYCQGFDLFKGIFDGAAIGQYVGGIHWLNIAEDTRFFVNESSDLDLSKLDFSWQAAEIGRIPFVSWEGTATNVLSIHAHSKELAGISPFNTGLQIAANEIISGERLQALADLTISTKEINKFHIKADIDSANIVEIPMIVERAGLFKRHTKLAAPSEDFIEKCGSARKLFVYTHLLSYFKKYIAPRLKAEFILITHNSDQPVTIEDLELLNQPNLVRWYAQNVQVSHSKLMGIPIGVANKQWGEQKIDQLVRASHTVKKTEMVYANFSASTHPLRVDAQNALKDIAGITIEQGVSFEQYIKQLAAHKFCVCPRGNGIDTHRFWEAQYLDCIPIILRRDWIEAYSGLPIVLLESWQELDLEKLKKTYIRICTTRFDRGTLRLSHFRAMLNRQSYA